MRSDRKVIILDNIKSDCIEQAMFILKDTKPDNIDAVREAERIVENYTKKYHYHPPTTNNGVHLFLSVYSRAHIFQCPNQPFKSP